MVDIRRLKVNSRCAWEPVGKSCREHVQTCFSRELNAVRTELSEVFLLIQLCGGLSIVRKINMTKGQSAVKQFHMACISATEDRTLLKQKIYRSIFHYSHRAIFIYYTFIYQQNCNLYLIY